MKSLLTPALDEFEELQPVSNEIEDSGALLPDPETQEQRSDEGIEHKPRPAKETSKRDLSEAGSEDDNAEACLYGQPKPDNPIKEPLAGKEDLSQGDEGIDDPRP